MVNSTMKIAKKQRKIPKKVIVLALGLLVIGGAGAFGLYESQKANQVASTDTAARPINSVDYNPPTPDEQKQQEDTKTDVIKKNDDASNPPAQSNISVTISRINQGGKSLPLNVRTIINGTNSGTCTVTLTKSGQPTVTKTFPIIVQATYSTCQQADIAASEFSVDGDWNYSVTAANGSSTSNAATGSVTIAK
jgi:hypothetical protein